MSSMSIKGMNSLNNMIELGRSGWLTGAPPLNEDSPLAKASDTEGRTQTIESDWDKFVNKLFSFPNKVFAEGENDTGISLENGVKTNGLKNKSCEFKP